MRPLSLTLKGIGPFRDETNIDFADLVSPVAIVAPYGSGKSWICEAILYALYAKGGWYTGSIYDAQTQGGDGQSYIYLTFEHDGRTYRIERYIANGHSAMVFHDGVDVAGPKVGDVANWVEANVGTWETTSSTWFLSQSRSNDLCGQPGEKDLVARRRAVFNELLGIADLDAEAERARAARAKCAAQIEVLEAQLAGDNGDGDVRHWTAKLQEAQTALAIIQADSKRADDAVGNERERLRQLDVAEQAAANDMRDAEAQIRNAERIIMAEADRHRQVQELRARVAETASAQAEVAALEDALSSRAALLPDLAGRETWEDHMRGYERAAAQQEALRREIAALRSSLPDDETVTMAKRLPEITASLERLQEANDLARANNDAINERRAHHERSIATHQMAIDRLQKRISQRPITPFGDNCSPCPLLREWAGLPDELAREEEELSRLKCAMAALPDLHATQDDSDLRTLQAQAMEAHRACQRGNAAKAKIRELEAQQIELVPPNDEPQDPRPQIAFYQDMIERLSGAPERRKANERAKKELGEALRAHAEADRAKRDAQRQKDQASAVIAARNAHMATMADDRLHAESAVAEAEKLAGELRADAQRGFAAVGRAEAGLEAAERHARIQAEKRAQVRELTTRRAALDDLTMCFGPRGVRQILVDAAAPELEDIADQLFEMATEGRMRLRIATQKALKDGSVAEDFSIMVKDALGERDVVQHSGGEIQLIAILFRLAVAMWIARLRGRRPDVLVLDEAFDRLGSDGTADLLRVLDSMANRIGCVIVVTHDEGIADRLGSKVRVAKRLSGSAVC